MSHSLIPEKPLFIYPSLAKSLGLEEAVMLCALADICQHFAGHASNGYHWYQLSAHKLQSILPFWDLRDIQRVSTNLREKAVILIASPPIVSEPIFKFAFNQGVIAPHSQATPATSTPAQPLASSHSHYGQNCAPVPATAYETPANGATPSLPEVQAGHFLSKNYIASNWQPEVETFTQLAQHGIPQEFARQQLPEFITYWRERGETHHSWGSKFIKHVAHQWQKFERKKQTRDQEIAMHASWRPSHEAMEILVEQAGVSRDFIEDAVPEFILYWQERGDRLKTWNSKFIQHIRLQWKKFHSALESSTDPKTIRDDWQPSEDVFDVLRLANIELRFARELIPEFVIYWRDSGQVHTSWNTRYLQHVKHRWAQRHQMASNLAGNNSQPTSNRSTRDLSLEEQLTDRSWAE